MLGQSSAVSLLHHIQKHWQLLWALHRDLKGFGKSSSHAFHSRPYGHNNFPLFSTGWCLWNLDGNKHTLPEDWGEKGHCGDKGLDRQRWNTPGGQFLLVPVSNNSSRNINFSSWQNNLSPFTVSVSSSRRTSSLHMFQCPLQGEGHVPFTFHCSPQGGHVPVTCFTVLPKEKDMFPSHVSVFSSKTPCSRWFFDWTISTKISFPSVIPSLIPRNCQAFPGLWGRIFSSSVKHKSPELNLPGWLILTSLSTQ